MLAPLAALDEDWFDAAFQQPFEELVWSLHGGYAHLRKPGGRVVVVVPTIAMAGAPGLAATAAAAEGQRLLVKAAARQWGAEGIVMNIVAADLRALAAGAIDLPPVSLSPPALGEVRVTDLAAVARAIGALASDDEATVTGATVIVDGGTWMAP